MSPEPQPLLSVEEYLALDRRSEIRSEYADGEIFAMSGASREHNLIGTNIVAALHPQLRRRGCEIYSSDMKVRIPLADRYVYPGVAVVCGEPRFEDDERDILLNPTLVAEILSPSTEDYDRGRKFADYRGVPSLRVYLLVAQDRLHVEHFVRQGEGPTWLLTETDDRDAVLDLPEVGATLALADVYDRVPGIGELSAGR